MIVPRVNLTEGRPPDVEGVDWKILFQFSPGLKTIPSWRHDIRKNNIQQNDT